MPSKRHSSSSTSAAAAAATANSPFFFDSQPLSGLGSGIGTSSSASKSRRHQPAALLGNNQRDSSGRFGAVSHQRRGRFKLTQTSSSLLSESSSDENDDAHHSSDPTSRMLTSVCWLFAVLCGTIAIVAFTQLQAAPSLHDTQKHCARRAIQLQTQFDTQALSLVRHLIAFLSAIGNTTTEAFASYVATLNPDPHLVAAVTLYQRVTQRTRAQWVRDYSAIMAPPRTDIWSLPDVTLRPSNLAELWPCIAQVPISNASKMAAVTFPFIGFDPLGEASRAAPLLKTLASPTAMPSMTALVRWPADQSLGFNIYARNYRPVTTRSNVSRELAVAVHFMGKGLFDSMWTPNSFDYLVSTGATDLFRTSPTHLLLTEISSTISVTLVDRPIQLNCYARPVHGLFAYRYGSHLALFTSLVFAIGFAALALQVPKRLARALRSSGDLQAARSMIRSLHGRAQAILMAIEVPVALVDVVGRIVPLNEPARAWMGGGGGDSGEVLVKDVVDLPDDDGPEHEMVHEVEVEVEHEVAPAADWITLDSSIHQHGVAPGSPLPYARSQSAVVLPPIEQVQDQPHLPFRPGLVQVTVRRPADGFEYPAQISASGPFTVPSSSPAPTPAPLQKPSRILSALDRLCTLLPHRSATAQQINDTELALVTTSSSASTSRSRPSARSRSQHTCATPPTSQTPPLPSHQQVILITDLSDAATRASDLEHARAQLGLAHKACTDMLLLLCHELRNPAHVISGLLADTDTDRNDNNREVVRVSALLAQYLDQGTLVLGQETDANVPGVPVRGWALVELVRTVCRYRSPSGLAAVPKVVADPRVMRMAPTGGAQAWQRMVRVMLGVAVDVSAGLDSAVFELRPAWGAVSGTGDGWRVNVAVRIPLHREQTVVQDMLRVADWAAQARQVRLASGHDVFGVSQVPPAPPEPTTWAGLHVLVLWRQAVAVAGRDPRVSVSLEREVVKGKGDREVVVVAVDVECHLV